MKKFNAFDRVLIRQSANHAWSADLYDRYIEIYNNHAVVSGVLVEDENILPYNEKTKHLHNTVDEFVEWMPKKGEPILVRDNEDTYWNIRIFLGMDGDRFIATNTPETPHMSYVWDQAKPYVKPFKE